MVEDAIVKSQHSQANKSKHNVSLKGIETYFSSCTLANFTLLLTNHKSFDIDAITHQIRMKKDKKCSVRLTPYLTAGHF